MQSERRAYRTFLDRLATLPDVFTLSTFERMEGVSRDSASVILSRWAKNRYVERAGPKSGVWFNLMKAPEHKTTGDMEINALRMSYPSAVLSGASVLHSCGWTSQIPKRLTCTILSRRTFSKLDAFDIEGRDEAWYDLMKPFLLNGRHAGFSTYGLPSLPPALALADMFKSKQDWLPDPDDLELDSADWLDVADAFHLLGLPTPDKYRAEIEAAQAEIEEAMAAESSASPSP
jgi:hypothetical protein